MSTKNSRAQDKIARAAADDMADGGKNRGIEEERNPACPAGPDTHSAGSIGGGPKVDGIGNLKITKGPPAAGDED